MAIRADPGTCVVALVLLFLGALASNASGKGSPSAQASALRDIVTAGQLAGLRWPDFSDYRPQVQAFYEASDYHLAWIRDNEPTPQAQELLEILRHADDKGLDAEDYDASRWGVRVSRLSQPLAAAEFDAALTVCVMRYSSDLHLGKINPRHFKFDLVEMNSRYDLAQFVRQRLVEAQHIPGQFDQLEPGFSGYKNTRTWLQRYLELSRHDDGEQLPVPSKSLEPGGHYVGVPRLTRLLRMFGDLPAGLTVPEGDIYQAELVDGVRHFQSRHGLTPDGRIGPKTLTQLNTPLTTRIEQLRLVMERWRWLPHEFPQPSVVVNIPEFRLRAFDPSGNVVLRTNVIVGKAFRHQTPVFDDEIQYVVFRPYWNVPPSIQRSEIVPAIQRDRSYVAKRNYEVITHAGDVVTSGIVDDDVLDRLRAGNLAVRQKPGPANALGLVKLIFPNQYNVYLHSSPSQQLFSKDRRDFSHGCIRVEKADELTAWVLQGTSEWTLERVRTAMREGKNNVRVNLAQPIPVLILYGTAVVDQDGEIEFFDDLYGYDADLRKALAAGYPFPH